ncbi:MAG: AAA family ATPase [Lachnospiraceae bacterium]|nr:AAA family ATPase [Lachnospiraceae bacterium]
MAALVVAVIICAIAATAALNYMNAPSEKVSYSKFCEYMDSKKLDKVELAEDKISFMLKGENGKYITDNPETPDIKERILLSGAEVTKDSETAYLVTYVLDIIFDFLFFGIIGFLVYKFISYSRKTFKLVRHTGVHFDDIAGMERQKSEMMWLVNVLKNKKNFSEKGIRQVKGVILEGPPGNGKTLFAKALAEESGVNFIATRGADFQSVFMSMGSMKIKRLFNKAKRHKPCIVFIDEFDSIGERRNYAGTGIDKENNRIITTMLNEMDGFEASDGILVIAATNSYTSLDGALIRPGRFDVKYTIGKPDQDTRVRILEIYTKDKKLAKNIEITALAAALEGQSCAAIETLINTAATIAEMNSRSGITMSDISKAAADTHLKLKVNRAEV